MGLISKIQYYLNQLPLSPYQWSLFWNYGLFLLCIIETIYNFLIIFYLPDYGLNRINDADLVMIDNFIDLIYSSNSTNILLVAHNIAKEFIIELLIFMAWLYMALFVYPLNHTTVKDFEFRFEIIDDKKYIRCKELFLYTQYIVQHVHDEDTQILMYKLMNHVCNDLDCTPASKERLIRLSKVIKAFKEYRNMNNTNKHFNNACNIIINELELEL